MAGRTVMACPNWLPRSALQLSSISCRSWSTLTPRQTVRYAQPLKTLTCSKSPLQNSFRRTYADSAASPPPPPPPPPPKPKRRFRFVRWTLRLTLLTAVGGVVALGYGAYTHQHPVEQFEPDREKKTLVILGKHTCLGTTLIQSHEG